MKINEMNLLSGTEIIPIPEISLQELLANEHSVWIAEAEDGELDCDFIKRAFGMALTNPDIAKSTRQCMVVHIPVGRRNMFTVEKELLDSYMDKWMAGDSEYQINWGLYEIDCTGLRITFVANTPVSAKEETEVSMDDMEKGMSIKRKLSVMGIALVVGVVSIALSIHYMSLGAVCEHPESSFFDYLKNFLNRSFNKYDAYSMMYWMIGGAALLYSVLLTNIKKGNKYGKKNNA